MNFKTHIKKKLNRFCGFQIENFLMIEEFRQREKYFLSHRSVIILYGFQNNLFEVFQI